MHQTFNERTIRAFKSSYVKNHNFSPAYDRKRSFFCVETLLPSSISYDWATSFPVYRLDTLFCITYRPFTARARAWNFFSLSIAETTLNNVALLRWGNKSEIFNFIHCVEEQMIVARSAGSLLASSPIWAREASLARAREWAAFSRGFALPAQIGQLACRLERRS